MLRIFSVARPPNKIGMVSRPPIRSPWISIRSDNAVRQNTIPAAKMNETTIDEIPAHSSPENEGMIAADIAHPIDTSGVFDPGISFNDDHLPPKIRIETRIGSG